MARSRTRRRSRACWTGSSRWGWSWAGSAAYSYQPRRFQPSPSTNRQIRSLVVYVHPGSGPECCLCCSGQVPNPARSPECWLVLAGGLTPGLTCPALATLPRCRTGASWEASTVGGDGELARGHEAAGRLAWADAYGALSPADQSASRAVEDLERLGTAAYLLGRVADCLGALQRAQQLHAEAGDPRRAARLARFVGFDT